MRKPLLFILFGSIALLSGCNHWPEQGRGGFAEHHLQTLQPMEEDYRGVAPDQTLRLELDVLSRHLDVLVLEGAELCFPATVVQAKERQNRITREIAGGLNMDAANDIVIQRSLLYRLERQLDYVLEQAVCELPKIADEKKPGDMAKQIHDLLNADNQFAFGSSEINPKYVGRLAEATRLLVEHGQYRLIITGHADAVGNDNENQELSQKRAEQVSRYLQIFGLPGQRMTTNAVGANDPLFEGMQPEVRLTNRRVSIQLIENQQNAPQGPENKK